VFHDHLHYFQKPPLEGKPNTKLGDHGTPNVHSRWLLLFIHMWRPTWIEIHWNSIWLRTPSHMTSQYTWTFVTTLHDPGTAFGHFVLGSHNFMVTALGPCVKRPLLHMAHLVIFLERTSISRQVEHRHRFVSFTFHISVTYIPAAFKKSTCLLGIAAKNCINWYMLA
jgi:hypothetical protein